MGSRFLFGIAAILIGTHTAHAEKPDSSYEIIPEKSESKLFKQCSRSSPTQEGLWTPQANDVNNLETRFRKCASAAMTKSFDDYFRQYGGFIRNKRKMIYLNAVLKSQALGVKTQTPYIICDGNEITFGLEYDVTSQSFANFEFNGPRTDKVDDEKLRQCDQKK